MRWGGWGSNPRPSDYEYALQPFTRDQERPDLGKRTQSATPGQAELLPKLLPASAGMSAFVSSPHGSQIGAPAGRRHDAARTLVTLAPGATAHATLAVSDVLIGDNCRHRRVPVNWIQVYRPVGSVRCTRR